MSHAEWSEVEGLIIKEAVWRKVLPLVLLVVISQALCKFNHIKGHRQGLDDDRSLSSEYCVLCNKQIPIIDHSIQEMYHLSEQQCFNIILYRASRSS
jgi:hypothetical protein